MYEMLLVSVKKLNPLVNLIFRKSFASLEGVGSDFGLASDLAFPTAANLSDIGGSSVNSVGISSCPGGNDPGSESGEPSTNLIPRGMLE